jgi:hypothetical protein
LKNAAKVEAARLESTSTVIPLRARGRICEGVEHGGHKPARLRATLPSGRVPYQGSGLFSPVSYETDRFYQWYMIFPYTNAPSNPNGELDE